MSLRSSPVTFWVGGGSTEPVNKWKECRQCSCALKSGQATQNAVAFKRVKWVSSRRGGERSYCTFSTPTSKGGQLAERVYLATQWSPQLLCKQYVSSIQQSAIRKHWHEAIVIVSQGGREHLQGVFRQAIIAGEARLHGGERRQLGL